MRKAAFSMYENEDADQLRGNDQRLNFRYKKGRYLLYLKSKTRMEETNKSNFSN